MLSFYLSIVETDEDKEKVVFLYENYYSFMCYTAGQVLNHNKFDVEDAVHNAMLKLIENLDSIDFSNLQKTKNLCGIVAKNKARDLLKRREKQNVSLEDDVRADISTAEDPRDILIRNNTYELILHALDSLDDKYRDLCIMKYVHGLKEKESAALLDITPHTVSTRIFRGKQILRDALRKEAVYES